MTGKRNNNGVIRYENWRVKGNNCSGGDIEDLESDELQERATFDDLNRLNKLFIFLAKKGVSSQERYALERDIKELL